MKATPEELQFHQRIMARNDPIVWDQLATWLYPILVQNLRKRVHQEIDPVLAEEAVGEAFLNYCRNPERYNPQLNSLRGFILKEAEYDLKNALARERRQTQYQVSLVSPYDTNEEQDIIDESQDLEAHVQGKELREHILSIFTNPVDRNIAELILDRIRSPEPYIDLLDLDGLPRSEQTKQVKRHKDRIKWHLRGIGEHFDE
jgi:DNA-directed RNA polymerase specialized sigma24 family protein